MNYLIFAVLGYLAGSLLPERLIPGEKSGEKRRFAISLLDVLLGFLPVFAAGFFLDQTHPGFILVMLAPAFGHGHPLLQKWEPVHLLAIAAGSMAGLIPLWQPVALLAVAVVLFFRVIRIDPYIFRILAVFLSVTAVSFLLLGAEVVSWGCLFLTYFTASQELENYQGEKIRIRLLPR